MSVHLKLDLKTEDKPDQKNPDRVEVDYFAPEDKEVFLEVQDNQDDSYSTPSLATVCLTPREARKIGKALIAAAKEAKQA